MVAHSHQGNTDTFSHEDELIFNRYFTDRSIDPLATVTYEKREAKIQKLDGTVVFQQKDVEVPEFWSQSATNVLAQKYFRKQGVPQKDGASYAGETSAKQVVNRLAETWRHWGDESGYFYSDAEASAFEDEIKYMLIHQIAAPNSPQFFNTGLHHKYGITGEPQGTWYVDPETGEAVESTDAYSRPAAFACYIQSLRDDLVNEGGIFDLLTREARVFKFGAGSGVNYSNLRGKGEKLSGGGESSGLMSFLKIFDAAAGAIKSGGTTRRSARMCVVDVDHPEIEDFINWKVEEERKVAALVATGYDSDYEGEAYRTVSGQNANNSIRVTDDFMEAVENNGTWDLINRSDGNVYKTVQAVDLWNQICQAAWQSADPGLQFHDTVNRWNTCSNSGEIRATNPCSEFNWIDNSACNLASLNLVKFYDDETQTFDIEGFIHATRLWTVVLDITVEMGQLPSKEIAEGVYKYRTLGLGYANLGALLMRMGFPYDSPGGRNAAGAITSIMTGESYTMSALLAGRIGAFPEYQKNQKPMLNVISQHRDAANELELNTTTKPLYTASVQAWDRAVHYGVPLGYRNAQTTLLAPTGTIGLLMDCDTTGIEPDFSLVKFKQLSGGGDMMIVNQSVPPALKSLGYDDVTITEIVNYIADHGTIEGSSLKSKHLAVFDCANRSGDGKRYIAPMGHVNMLAAVQPFLSGSASKTVNLPASAEVMDIAAIYREAWKQGVKCVALYRDGSKLSQPLSSKKDDVKPLVQTNESESLVTTNGYHASGVDIVREPEVVRQKLPGKRYGFTQEVTLAGHKIFIRTSEYEDGRLGEIFVDLHKEGAALRSLMGCFSIAVSKGLQYGVPLDEYVQSFVHQRFEPQGMVQNHPNIKMATSIIDLIFRVLALEYLDQHDVAQVPPKSQSPNVTRSVLNGSSTEASTEVLASVATVSFKEEAGVGEIPAGADSQDQQLSTFGGDAPFCTECGHLTLRSGNCYRCLNCGESLGCS